MSLWAVQEVLGWICKSLSYQVIFAEHWYLLRTWARFRLQLLGGGNLLRPQTLSNCGSLLQCCKRYKWTVPLLPVYNEHSCHYSHNCYFVWAFLKSCKQQHHRPTNQSASFEQQVLNVRCTSLLLLHALVHPSANFVGSLDLLFRQKMWKLQLEGVKSVIVIYDCSFTDDADVACVVLRKEQRDSSLGLYR